MSCGGAQGGILWGRCVAVLKEGLRGASEGTHSASECFRGTDRTPVCQKGTSEGLRIDMHAL